MQIYYPNPFILVLETEKNYVVKNGTKFEKVLVKTDYRHFINQFQKQEPMNMRELEVLFSQSELVELFSSHILLDSRLELSSEFSRTIGYFSLTSTESTYPKLKEKKNLILGAGAIGTHLAWQLAATGISKLIILDFDQIELSNLNRQLLYQHRDIEQNKVEILKKRLGEIFPELIVDVLHKRLSDLNDVREIVDSSFDLVVKAIDTPNEMTDWIGQVAFENKICMVQGGYIGTTGVVGPHYFPEKTPCYRCYPQEMKISRLSGTGATQSSMTELVAGKIGLDIMNMLQNQRTAYSGMYEFLDDVTNKIETVELELIEHCTVCNRNNSKQKTLPKIIDILYLMLVFIMPMIVTFNHLDVRFNLLGLAIFCIVYTLVQENEQKNFQLQFQAAVSYVISLFILNIFLGVIRFELTHWVVSIAQIGLQEMFLITASVAIFEGVAYVTKGVKKILI